MVSAAFIAVAGQTFPGQAIVETITPALFWRRRMFEPDLIEYRFI